MAEYIKREDLIEWIKKIPLKDLSNGHGLCRVIMEDDFKFAIKSIPESAIVDAVDVVRCKDCEHSYPELSIRKGKIWCDNFDCDVSLNGYCNDGERKNER